MVSGVTVIEQRVHFGGGIDPSVNACLQQAAAAPQDDASAELLEKAALLAPASLAVGVARLKYHFYRGELRVAQDLAEQALDRAAAQGGFAADWRGLAAPLSGREHPEGAARYYLYALKALSFIHLRRRRFEQSRRMLDALSLLDPDDLVGASVIRDLFDAMEIH